jgi:YD repeat-containing protein
MIALPPPADRHTLRSRLSGGAGPLALVLATASCGLAAQPAAASTNIAPPPEKFAVSPGGVDMRSGRYVYNQTDVSIGGESSGLALNRTLTQQVAGHTNPFANFSHNWDVLVSEKRVDIERGDFKHIVGHPDYQMEINFGGRSQTFRAYGTQGGFDLTSRSGYGILTQTGADRSSGTTFYTFQSGDGTMAVFRPMGSADCSTVLRCAYVDHIVQADGTTLSFDYDNLGAANTTRLRSITSNRGYALLLEYSGTLVSKACVLNLTQTVKPSNNLCPVGAASASYTYENIGETRLASVTDPTGGVWGFVNQSNSIGFVKPGQSSPWLTNSFHLLGDDDGLVSQVVDSQSFADGQSYAYAYQLTPFVEGHFSSIAGGAFTNAKGETTTLLYGFPIKPHAQQGYGNVPCGCIDEPASPIVYQVTPGPVEVTDPLGHTTTNDYCDPFAMANLPSYERDRCIVSPAAVSTTDPGGITTYLTWDFVTRNLMGTRQVARPVAGQPPLPDLVRSATYYCTPAEFSHCAKPTSVTDERGNTTEYTYDPVHGGVTSETLPAPTPGAPRPQTRYTYAQRHAWISNGAGGYVQVSAPVYVLTKTSLCKTGAASGTGCATSGDEVVTTYDYGPDSGPNNLELRGAVVDQGGLNLRTCAAFDAAGNKLSETKPRAGLTSCP